MPDRPTHACWPILALSGALAAILIVLGCERRSSAGSAGDARDPLTVFAAASTTDVMQSIGEAYQRTTGVEVRFSFGSSSTLARQIRAGAPADVFISADEKWMDDVSSAGAIDAGTRQDLLANRLVLIGPKDSTLSVRAERGSDFPGPDKVRRLAMGDPTHVPAGRYGRQALQRLGWWSGVESRVISAQDVRAALRLVEIGEADAGIVYSTDARKSDKVRILAEFPEECHDPVRYPVALTRSASAGTHAFLSFLRSPESIAIFERAGFTVVPAAAPAKGGAR